MNTNRRSFLSGVSAFFAGAFAFLFGGAGAGKASGSSLIRSTGMIEYNSHRFDFPKASERLRFGWAKSKSNYWFHKEAFDGGILYYPPGHYTDATDPENKIPYRDLARFAMESAKNGGAWAFDSVYTYEPSELADKKEQPLSIPADQANFALQGFLKMLADGELKEPIIITVPGYIGFRIEPEVKQ